MREEKEEDKLRQQIWDKVNRWLQELDRNYNQ